MRFTVSLHPKGVDTYDGETHATHIMADGVLVIRRRIPPPPGLVLPEGKDAEGWEVAKIYNPHTWREVTFDPRPESRIVRPGPGVVGGGLVS